MDKLVIANPNKGGHGKRTSIKEVLKQLVEKYHIDDVSIPANGDVHAIILWRQTIFDRIYSL